MPLIIVLIFLFLSSCNPLSKEQKNQFDGDLPEIRQRGKLVAITGYNAISYFIYHGQPMGYEYELLEMLATHLDLDFEIVLAHNLDQIINQLETGKGDIISYAMTVTKSRARRVSFTIPHMTVSMSLVQRKPENWRNMKQHEIEKQLIRNPIDLIGKKVHVRRESSYFIRLQNLSEEIGGDIDIVEVRGDISTSEIIKQVAEGEIDYTASDENIAMLDQAYYRNLDIKTRLSLPQQIAWAVRKDSPLLLEEVNNWIEQVKDSVDYYVIYNKYFKNRTAFRERAKSDYLSVQGGAISPYDSTIKAQAVRLNWDWRLLASQIYQESQFDPSAKSWAGAVGLMQLMPTTAKEYGGRNLNDPIESIEVGVNYLLWLNDYWGERIQDSVERIKFILGSYNVGYNHIVDAQRLSEKLGKSPDLWVDNVAEMLLNLSKAKYFNDEVVKFGYCRGQEPVNYVAEIEERYKHYTKLVNEVVAGD